MLTLPAAVVYPDVTVYADDAEINRFYVIPSFPQLRKDKNGDPVFLLLKYAFSDQGREENPELTRGGGYLSFDAELAVSKERMDELRVELQKLVEEKWQALKDAPPGGPHRVTMSANLPSSPISNTWKGGNVGFTGRQPPPQHSGAIRSTITLPGHDDFQPPGDDEEAPKVVFGEPLWKAGKVSLNAPQSDDLVGGRVAEQPASMVGSNVAAFSMDLTEHGATLMQKVLTDPDTGGGGSNTTPLQVVYEMTMVARLPPAKVFIKYDSMQVYKEMHELWHEKCTGCGDDFYTSESTLNQALKAGLVTIKVDMGGITDPEMVQLLTDQALTTAREIVVDTFTDKIERPEGPPEEWANSTGLSDEIEIVMAEEEVYRLKQHSEVAMVSFEQTIEMETAIEHTIAPQGTLQTFFGEEIYSDPEKMKNFVREIDLDDMFFKTLGMKARAFANWDVDHIAFVEVEVKYEGKHEDGREELKTKTFTFTADDHGVQKWDPSLIGSSREYDYRWRVGFEGREAGDNWTEWFEKETNRELNVSVETPGKIEMEVVGAGLDFKNVLDAVLVHLRYKDNDMDPDVVGNSLVLTADRQSGNWSQLIYVRWDKAVDYACEYLLKDGSMWRNGWASEQRSGQPDRIQLSPRQQTLLITPPQVDVLNIALVPAGLWAGVRQSVVSVRYEHDDVHADEIFQIKSPDEFKEWAVLLRDADYRKWEYKVLTTFDNGDSEESSWVEKEGDQAVAVQVFGPPRLQVVIVSRVIDFAVTPTVEVTLQHNDPELGVRTETFTLTKPDDSPIWDIPISDKKHKKYRYQIKYFPKEIDPVEMPWENTNDTRVTPVRYDIPKVGARLVPAMVDFKTTPVVEVELKYSDPQRGVTEVGNLIFTADDKKPQEWFVHVEDGAPRAYTISYRYHLEDGETVEVAPKRMESQALIIPRYRPPQD